MNDLSSTSGPTRQLPRFVPRNMSHHGAHSGYDQLFRHMGLVAASSRWGHAVAKIIPGFLAWRLWSMRPQATTAVGLRAELGAMPWVATGRGRICHFIYGEDTYFLTPLWQTRANRSIATFHYPPDRLAMRVNPGSIKSLHTVVIVGENQRAYFEQLLPPERIHLCLHAVDTGFFCPDPAPPASGGPLRLVCSGTIFRDFRVLLDVHRVLRAQGHDFVTDIVGANEEQRASVEPEPGFQIHRKISDEELRALYRAAAVGVLPLTDATANNALLELMACGRPVVVSDVGAVIDYTAGSAVHLVPEGDVQAMVMAVGALLSDASQRQCEGQANRNHAVATLAFEPIAARMRAIYATCAA